MVQFQVGDSVTWKSQANGSSKEKTGTVVEVVPANRQLKERGWEERFPCHVYDVSALDAGGQARQATSYLVAVQTQDKKQKLYWPRAHGLKKV